LAWTRVQLAIIDGPHQAFDAIRRVPAPEQDALWLDLFRVCFGRGDTAASDSAAVSGQITAPALRRQIELEALQSNIPLRPAEAILAEIREKLKATAPGKDQVRLLLELADTHRRATGPEAAAIPLRSALEAAKALPDPVQRATLLAELTELLPDALLFPESKQALQDATEAARGIIAPDQRLPLLVVILHHAFNAGEIQTAAALATEAMEIAPKVKLSPPLVAELADFLTRLGDWPAALSLLPEVESKTAAPDAQPSKTPESGPPVPSPLPATPAAETAASRRRALLDAIATTAAEEAIGYDPAAPPNRGEPLDRIRNRAISDESAAASYLPGIPAGYQRARATLAIAKGLLLPPIPSAETPLPTDLSGPLDLLPGQSPDVPVMPEDPEAK
jgi:tetratricopeptide (TPR) repeat protein